MRPMSPIRTGQVEFYKNDVRGPDGQPLYDMVPMIDESFGQMLFTTSGLAQGPSVAQILQSGSCRLQPGWRQPRASPASRTPGKHINEDWDLPEYEPQRPAGVYMVDEAPVNTMVLAMTRAGKGQTYIEPMIDMWLREAKPNNMVVNDPKGELLVKNYIRATQRGYQVIQFNLINALKTDIYNPLAMASEAALRGGQLHSVCAVRGEHRRGVLLPVGADDPWAQRGQQRLQAHGLRHDRLYLEEERQMRKRAVVEGWTPRCSRPGWTRAGARSRSTTPTSCSAAGARRSSAP